MLNNTNVNPKSNTSEPSGITSHKGVLADKRYQYAGPSSYEIYLEKQITVALNAVTVENKQEVKLSDIGAVLRYLDCFPSESELTDVLHMLKQDEQDCVTVSAALPVIKDILMCDRFKPASKETILQAFEILKNHKDGALDTQGISDFLSNDGEKFTEEELSKFKTVMETMGTDEINFEEYCDILLHKKAA